MSADIGAKLLDFMFRLFTIASIDPSAREAFKDQQMIIEIQFADCPEAKFQIEAHQNKLTVYKGTPKEPTAILEYAKVEFLKDCLQGRISYINTLLVMKLLPKKGSNEDVVFFFDSMEKALKRAWMMLRNEFPPLPPPSTEKPSSIYCKYCGCENERDSIFCKKCGKKIGG